MSKKTRKSLIGTLIMFLAIMIIIILSVNQISYSSSNNKIESKFQFFKPVIEKLLKKNVDTSFINYLLASPDTKFNPKYVRINVNGFLKKPDYSVHYNDYSVKKCIEFSFKYDSNLTKCFKKYKIPKEIITALLWIETKHGNFLGSNQIPSVFLSTAMASQDTFVKMNKENLHITIDSDTVDFVSLEKKIEKRAKSKTDWAINELVYLAKIYHKNHLDVNNIKGSWAGAFGLAQFLPSSFFKWAVDGDNDDVKDLFNVNDAIYSVANYLSINGWGDSDESHKKALYHYNHSKEYVSAILILAKKIKETQIQSLSGD